MKKESNLINTKEKLIIKINAFLIQQRNDYISMKNQIKF